MATIIWGLILVIIAILLIISIFFVKKNKKQKSLTPLAGIAFAFVLAGLIFSDNRLIVYGLMSIGVILAIIDTILKWKKK